MWPPPMYGCTLHITSIPKDMSVTTLRSVLGEYGSIKGWATAPGKLQAYVVYETADMARRALHAMRENRGVRIDYATNSG
jgi:hypothetical protein